MKQVNHKLCVQCLTYNQASYITDTMDGFCMQKTDFPYVCCIIDDSSTDGEQDRILAYLADNFIMYGDIFTSKETPLAKIIYARHKTNDNCYFIAVLLKKNLFNVPNGYQTKVELIAEWRNQCEYEAMCEGDDYWIDENKLQMQVNFLDTHKEYSVCSHRIKKYNQYEGVYYVDRLDSVFSNKRGIDFDNRSKVWVSETSSIVFRLAAHSEYDIYPYEKRDNIHVYYLLKYGKGFCFSNVMSIYRQHEGGIFSMQDVNTRLVNGTYLAVKNLYNYERTADAKRLYYSTYAYTFIKTKGRILFMEEFEIMKFMSLFRNVLLLLFSKHPLYIPVK